MEFHIITCWTHYFRSAVSFTPYCKGGSMSWCTELKWPLYCYASSIILRHPCRPPMVDIALPRRGCGTTGEAKQISCVCAGMISKDSLSVAEYAGEKKKYYRQRKQNKQNVKFISKYKQIQIYWRMKSNAGTKTRSSRKRNIKVHI